MPPGPLAPVTRAAYAFEVALFVAGMALLLGWVIAARRGKLRAWVDAPQFPAWPGAGADLALLFFAAIAGGLVVPLILGFALRNAPISPSALTFILTFPGFELGLLGGIAAVHFGYKRLRVSAPGNSGHALIDGGLVFLAAWPLVELTTAGWTTLLQHAGVPLTEQTVAQIFQGLPTWPLRAAFAFFACVMAPFNEELLFRAGIFRWLRGILPRWSAVILSAVAFGGAHWLLDPQHGAASFVPLVVLGGIFALAYERTGRIETTMVAHALFNLNTLLALCAGVSS